MFEPDHPATPIRPTALAAAGTVDMPSAAAASLLKNSSIELSTNGEAAIRGASEVLPAGMAVYTPKMPRETLGDKLTQLRLLNKYGFNPIPHIVARQLESEFQLRDFLADAVNTAAVHRVLIIGGDGNEPVGPYRDSAAVIESGVLRTSGITAVDVAGYPDGHPTIPSETLLRDLQRKVDLAASQNLDLSVVTQFSFDPQSVARYCAELAKQVPVVPVYAGLAGPTSPAKLLRFARVCGVSTSIRAANKLGRNALRLATHSSPDDQFELLVSETAAGVAGNLAGIHLFSFGGFVDSSKWLDARARDAGLGS